MGDWGDNGLGQDGDAAEGVILESGVGRPGWHKVARLRVLIGRRRYLTVLRAGRSEL